MGRKLCGSARHDRHNVGMQILEVHVIRPSRQMMIFYTPFLTAPAGGPIFHRGAPRCRWNATPVTGVHWGDHEIGRGAPKQPEMQNLLRVEVSALKSDWGALQVHEKGW